MITDIDHDHFADASKMVEFLENKIPDAETSGIGNSLFNSWFACARLGRLNFIWRALNNFGQVTIQSLTDQIELLQRYPLSHVMIQVVYGVRPDTRCPREIGLRPAKLAQLAGQ
jgi:hypothetical protein